MRPLPQAMFTVKAGTSWGTPARNATWRATFGPAAGLPRAADDRLVHLTRERCRSAASASPAAAAPSWAAVSEARAPPNLPIGVRTAPATTTSRIRRSTPEGR